MRTEDGLDGSVSVSFPRRLAQRGKTVFNRLRHPSRRESARRRVAGLPPLKRILVLCLGNICRSPYGVARLTALSEDFLELEIRSSGLIGPGRKSPENALKAAKERGLDLNDHVSQLVTRDLVEWAELLVAMDAKQARALRRKFGAPADRILILGDLDPGSPERRTILDPIDRSEAVFLRTYERIDLCLGELLNLIRIAH